MTQTKPRIDFSYAQGAGAFEHNLTVTSADGVLIDIWFDGLDASHLYMNGIEFSVNSDDCKGLYVAFGSKLEMSIVPVSEIIRRANDEIEGIVREVETEQRDWDRHERSFSQPSL